LSLGYEHLRARFPLVCAGGEDDAFNFIGNSVAMD
jgi:hypothetical protein